MALTTEDFTIGERVPTRGTYMMGFPAIFAIPIPSKVFRKHFVAFMDMPVCNSRAFAITTRPCPCLFYNIIRKFTHLYHPLSADYTTMIGGVKVKHFATS